jgi:hypothetical protein
MILSKKSPTFWDHALQKALRIDIDGDPHAAALRRRSGEPCTQKSL